MLGRLAEAEERWREIVRVEPSGESLARLGRVYLWCGAVEDGERLLREAMARFPDDSSPYFHLGVYLKDEGELEEAKKLLQKSVDLDEWAPALVCLGAVLDTLEDPQRARRCYERAIVLEPEEPHGRPQVRRSGPRSPESAGDLASLSPLLLPFG